MTRAELRDNWHTWKRHNRVSEDVLRGSLGSAFVDKYGERRINFQRFAVWAGVHLSATTRDLRALDAEYFPAPR